MIPARDAWWLRMFRGLLDAEASGAVSPIGLASRWLALDQHVYAAPRRRRWTVTFAVPEDVAHFLDDADIRAKDVAYARRQRQAARAWLRTAQAGE